MAFWSDQPIARNKPDQDLSYLFWIKIKSSDLEWFETLRTKESEKLITKKDMLRVRWETDCMRVYVLVLGFVFFFSLMGVIKRLRWSLVADSMSEEKT